MAFEEHEVRLRTGVCPSCSKEFAFVEGTTVSGRLGSPPAGGGAEPEGEEGLRTAAESGLECEECGSPLSVRDGGHGSLEVACPECETTTIVVPKRGPPREGRERPGRFDAEPPRGRPCRKCGAPLRFSTGEDGLLVGECDACGNRFTLPPRPERDRDARGYGGGRRFGRREYSRGPGTERAYPSQGQGRRPYRGADRRGRARYEDDDRARKRRRRPSM